MAGLHTVASRLAAALSTIGVLAFVATGALSQEKSISQRQLKRFHTSEIAVTGSLRVTSDPEALALVARIFQVYGLRMDPETFEVYVTDGGRGETATAEALAQNGKRYIIFNRPFMDRIRRATGNDWSLISIAAHEVQHHLLHHVEGPTANRKLAELEADYFAGYTLGKMGAPHDETTSAIRELPDQLGVDYPPRAKRVATISRGWDDAKNRGRADPPKAVGGPTDASLITDRYAIRNNRDIYGSDIASIAGRPGIAGQTIESCARICDLIGACRAFSYDRWKGSCYLKGGVTTSLLEPTSTIAVKKPDELPGAESAIRAVMQTLRNKAFRDEPYRSETVADFIACRSRCEGELRCVAFSYLKEPKQCRRFSYSEGYFADEGTDSGYKRQSPLTPAL